MKIINSENAPKAVGAYVQGIDCGDFVFFSGQIGLTPAGDFVGGSMENQLEQIFKNLDGVLEASDLKKENIVKCTVFITDMEKFGDMNQKYLEYFGDHKPARSCVGVATLPLGANVEIEMIGKK